MHKSKSNIDKEGQRKPKVTIKQIRSTAQKPKDQEAYLAWFVHRRISPLVTWVLAQTPVTPNAVTWSMFFVGFSGGILLSLKSPLLAFLGALCYQILYLLDCVDGELARVTKILSPIGEPLDRIMHYATDIALFTGTGMGLYFRTNQVFLLYVMLVIIVFHISYTFSIDVLFSLYPGKKKYLSNKIRTESGLKRGIFKIFGMLSSISTIFTILLITLGFDLFFPNLIHSWGISTFYYIVISVILVVRTCIRIPRFYKIARDSAGCEP